jgi:hypothetical protein
MRTICPRRSTTILVVGDRGISTMRRVSLGILAATSDADGTLCFSTFCSPLKSSSELCLPPAKTRVDTPMAGAVRSTIQRAFAATYPRLGGYVTQGRSPDWGRLRESALPQPLASKRPRDPGVQCAAGRRPGMGKSISNPEVARLFLTPFLGGDAYAGIRQ